MWSATENSMKKYIFNWMSNLELDPLSKRFSVTNKPVKPALYTPRQDVKRPLDYNDH